MTRPGRDAVLSSTSAGPIRADGGPGGSSSAARPGSPTAKTLRLVIPTGCCTGRPGLDSGRGRRDRDVRRAGRDAEPAADHAVHDHVEDVVQGILDVVGLHVEPLALVRRVGQLVEHVLGRVTEAEGDEERVALHSRSARLVVGQRAGEGLQPGPIGGQTVGEEVGARPVHLELLRLEPGDVLLDGLGQQGERRTVVRGGLRRERRHLLLAHSPQRQDDLRVGRERDDAELGDVVHLRLRHDGPA